MIDDSIMSPMTCQCRQYDHGPVKSPDARILPADDDQKMSGRIAQLCEDVLFLSKHFQKSCLSVLLQQFVCAQFFGVQKVVVGCWQF